MKVFVGIITDNLYLCDEYTKRRTGLIPRECLSSLSNVTLSVGAFNPCKSTVSAEEYLLHATREADASILIVDRKYAHVVTEVLHAFFTCSVEIPEFISNCKNFLGKVFSRLLRNFSYLISTLQQSEQGQAAILPIRNFDADAMRELVRVCRDETMNPLFAQLTTAHLSELRKRRRPRRRSAYKTQYWVDDADKHFEYGHEKHALPATGRPHTLVCEICGNFRFGKKIPFDRHFNVTRGAGDKPRISGRFRNCHDEMVVVKETSHINMFSNDFH
ncbi:hypothetical protein bAD24_I08540 [Burkholderia sp. AD24]|nr:hypothetical protein bAD24_I08540 [Burkholderia sp. AD24]